MTPTVSRQKRSSSAWAKGARLAGTEPLASAGDGMRRDRRAPIGEPAVGGVPLDRGEAGLDDRPAEELLRRAVLRAGGGDDVLLDHDAPHVVGAGAEPPLPPLDPLGEPGDLEVRDVVEVEAGDRHPAEV